MVTVIILSRKERFLNKTILDVLRNATGEIEVISVLDGYGSNPNELIDCDGLKYEPIIDPRVKYIVMPDNGAMQKRQGINAAVSIARGEYVMALDAHCMVAPGFDVELAKNCEDNWIVIPRRLKFDPETWTIRTNDDHPPIDYEYWIWYEFKKGVLKPFRWDSRHYERKDIMIDDVLTFQGSCWFMKKSYFQKMGFMKVEGYTGWGQEDVELAMECWTTGGRVVVNKNTWYAHLYKGKRYGRMYHTPMSQYWDSRKFAFDYWVNKRHDDFVKVLQKFMPIPKWTL